MGISWCTDLFVDVNNMLVKSKIPVPFRRNPAKFAEQVAAAEQAALAAVETFLTVPAEHSRGFRQFFVFVSHNVLLISIL